MSVDSKRLPDSMSQSEARSITIGLLWHSVNASNLGIGALTISNIAIIEEVANSLGISARFKVFQWRDPETDYVVGDNIEVVKLRGRHVFFHPMFLSEIRQCQAVLDIGAGDSFADIYGPTRFAKIACSKACVLLAGRPLILAPQTIGPFQRSWSRFLAGWLMKSAAVVVSRDNLTTSYVDQFQLGTKLLEATDVAFKLPHTPSRKMNGEPIRVGLNVSGLLINGGYSGKNMFDLKLEYGAMIRTLIRRFLEEENCEVHLVSHVVPDNMPVESDLLAAEKLQAEFPELIVVPKFSDPSAAKSYISGMDFFCGSRMHACIAAFSSGVPVLPIAYSRKFAGVFSTLSYSWLADCRSMSETEVVNLAMDAFSKRAELARDVEKSMTLALKKFDGYEQVLRQVMNQQSRLETRGA